MTNSNKKLGLRRLRSKRSSNCLRRSSLFTLYAKIFRLLLTKWDKYGVDEEKIDAVDAEEEYFKTLDNLVLPSNEEWRLRVYYTLVELQRELGCESSSDGTEEDADIVGDDLMPVLRKPRSNASLKTQTEKKWDWEPNSKIVYPLKPTSLQKVVSFESSSVSSMLEAQTEPGWRLKDMLLAARLLKIPPEKDEYDDEAEMRRVFGLVYDVLRYENVLDRALEDVNFWSFNPHWRERKRIVWLLLYDIQGRKFGRPLSTTAFKARNEALKEAGLLEFENALMGMKTKLAASLSRLRINGSALSLDELLPTHLRTAEGVCWGDEGSIACGWVNSTKMPSRKHFINEMSRLGFKLSEGGKLGELQEHHYVFDPLCPKVVNLHERAREKLATSDLVKSHGFIFMERTLCVGAAALIHAMRVRKLCGPVILTHPLAPRHAAYVAELLVDVEDAGRLLVFGLGDAKAEYRVYLEKLGIVRQRCKLFSEKFTSRPTSTEIERATLVLAVPPCSYTGVRDVVDLAIARGGDLGLLESLTSIEAESPNQPRALMAEQIATLRYAMTRPNVQLIVYEVHTVLPSETTEMIEEAVSYVNKMAKDKYKRDHPHPKKKTGGSGKKKTKRTQSQEHITKSDDSKSEEENPSLIHYQIPQSDFFETTTIDELYEQDCRKFLDRGSYVVVAKRKEMMQFNSLFMIKVAETKGVFGDTSKEPATTVTQEQQQQQLAANIAQPSNTSVRSKHKGHKKTSATSLKSSSSITKKSKRHEPGRSKKDEEDGDIAETNDDSKLEEKETFVNHFRYDGEKNNLDGNSEVNLTDEGEKCRSSVHGAQHVVQKIEKILEKSRSHNSLDSSENEKLTGSTSDLSIDLADFHHYFDKKSDKIFNISFKPSATLQHRRLTLRKDAKYRRMNFQNKLETVFEYNSRSLTCLPTIK